MSAEPDVITVGDPMPVIAGARPLHGQTLSVTWAEGPRAGLTEEVDLAPVLMQFRVFAPLRGNPALFATVSVIEDGTALGWADGRIDMAATTVERLAKVADLTRMTAEAFRAWMERHHFNYDTAGAAIGIGRRQIAYYLSGEKAIPRTVALACAGYDAVAQQAA